MESEKFKAPHSTSILSNRSPVSNSDVITVKIPPIEDSTKIVQVLKCETP